MSKTQDDLTLKQRLEVIQGQATQWRQARYNAEVNARVAEHLDDTEMRARSVADMARAEKALDSLAAIRKELEEAESPPQQA